MPIQVRAYCNADRDAVLDLWWRSWHSIAPGIQHPANIDQWSIRWDQEITASHEVVVACHDNEIVGFAAADLNQSILGQIFIDPSWKRKGIGRQLLLWARQSMPAGFVLHTLAENIESRAFYEAHGMKLESTGVSTLNGHPIVKYSWQPDS